MRAAVNPHLHVSLLHGNLFYCKGDGKGNDTVFEKGMTGNSFLVHYKKKQKYKTCICYLVRVLLSIRPLLGI